MMLPTLPVPPSEVSVVVQGPVAPNPNAVRRCVQSVRRVLPEAELILSTWEEDAGLVAGVDREVVQPSVPALYDASGTANNFNRQRRSTLAGLAAATRTHALKLRSDVELLDDRVLRLGSEARPEGSLSLLAQPITITNLFLRNPVRFPVLFHLADMVQFGCREAMLELWGSSDLEADSLRCSADDFPRWRGNWLGYTDFREVPEQSLMLGWVRRRGLPVELSFACELRPDLFSLWERLLCGNFSVIDHSECGVRFPARMMRPIYGPETVYAIDELREIAADLTDPAASRRRCEAAVRHASGMPALRCRRYWISMLSNLLFSASPVAARALRKTALRMSDPESVRARR